MTIDPDEVVPYFPLKDWCPFCEEDRTGNIFPANACPASHRGCGHHSEDSLDTGECTWCGAEVLDPRPDPDAEVDDGD